ncbi:spliceosome-associated protein CWC27 homolog [Rhinoraja longicauda]
MIKERNWYEGVECENRDLEVMQKYKSGAILRITVQNEELRRESRQLKREPLAAKLKKTDVPEEETESKVAETEPAPNNALGEYLNERKKYEELRRHKPKKGPTREEQTLALLDRFKSKLTKAISETPEEGVVQPEGEDDEGWMSHVLQFEEQTRKVKDANMQDEDTFEINDPRNPVNKRRREESKKIMKEKKERR